jgi:hypothetical protein
MNERLEERIALNSSFKFPAAILGPVNTIGLSGPRVLTSRTYESVQRAVDKAFKDFAKDFAKAWKANGGVGDGLDQALGLTPGVSSVGGGPGAYKGGLLGRLDRAMLKAEQRMPFGLGLSTSIHNTGGVGLSTLTAGTAKSSTSSVSVAELLDGALSSASTSSTGLKSALFQIELVRRATLKFRPDPITGIEIGILPGYVQAHGSGKLGDGAFGLKNS